MRKKTIGNSEENQGTPRHSPAAILPKEVSLRRPPLQFWAIFSVIQGKVGGHFGVLHCQVMF